MTLMGKKILVLQDKVLLWQHVVLFVRSAWVTSQRPPHSSWDILMNTINSLIHERGRVDTGLLFTVYQRVWCWCGQRKTITHGLLVLTYNQVGHDPFDLLHMQLFPNMVLLMLYRGNQKGPWPGFLTNTLWKPTVCALNQETGSWTTSAWKKICDPSFTAAQTSSLFSEHSCLREECHPTSLASESEAAPPAHLSGRAARFTQASCIPLPRQNGKEVLGGIPSFQWFSDGCCASEEFGNTVFLGFEQNNSETHPHWFCFVTSILTHFKLTSLLRQDDFLCYH